MNTEKLLEEKLQSEFYPKVYWCWGNGLDYFKIDYPKQERKTHLSTGVKGFHAALKIWIKYNMSINNVTVHMNGRELNSEDTKNFWNYHLKQIGYVSE